MPKCSLFVQAALRVTVGGFAWVLELTRCIRRRQYCPSGALACLPVVFRLCSGTLASRVVRWCCASCAATAAAQVPQMHISHEISITKHSSAMIGKPFECCGVLQCRGPQMVCHRCSLCVCCCLPPPQFNCSAASWVLCHEAERQWYHHTGTALPSGLFLPGWHGKTHL